MRRRILNLGETREQRVEMAFELAGSTPQRAHQPAQPAPGHQVRRSRADGSVGRGKWIAIFRLILPEALFRLCGGRSRTWVSSRRRGQGRGQRRDDGQLPDHARQHAGRGQGDVRGARPERDRPADNGANPGPTTARAGWTARRPDLVPPRWSRRRGRSAGAEVRLWEPTTQLKFAAKRTVPPRPDGAPNSGQGRETREAAARRSGGADPSGSVGARRSRGSDVA